MELRFAIWALIAFFSFGGAWKIQDWRYDAKEKERVEAKLVEVRVSAARDLRWMDAVFAARDKAAERAVVNRRDADGARTALIGLSNAADRALREAESSHAACIKSAAALDDVLKTVSGERRELSEKADRHVDDLITCREAWPK